ncbi:Uncharacterised protein [Mycobacteroides abscessus subsp. abscessus]|nr:Uncharacterised protein [Mycobacteroides abscessus subsp. abscessus]
MPRIFFQSYSAFRTQSLARVLTKGLERQLQNHCVPQNRFKVDNIAFNGILLVFFVIRTSLRSLLKNEELLDIC